MIYKQSHHFGIQSISEYDLAITQKAINGGKMTTNLVKLITGIIGVVIIFVLASCAPTPTQPTPVQSAPLRNTVLQESTSTGNENSTHQEIIPTNVIESLQADDEIVPGSLSPYFVFYADELYVVDYENRKIFQVWDGIYLTERYIVDFGSSRILQTANHREYTNLLITKCPYMSGNNVFDHYFLILCQVSNFPDNNMQLFDIRDGVQVGFHDFNAEGNSTVYHSILPSPDNKYFLLWDFSAFTRLFSVIPFQEIPINTDVQFSGELIASPDRKYVIANNEVLLKWNDNSIEVVDIFNYPEILLAASSDANELAFRVLGSNYADDIIVVDRYSGNEIFRYPVVDLLYGGFDPDYATFSPDGDYLWISGEGLYSENEGDQYVLQIDLRASEVVHVFGPFPNNEGLPWKLRIEYLPDQIRDTWAWEGY